MYVYVCKPLKEEMVNLCGHDELKTQIQCHMNLPRKIHIQGQQSRSHNLQDLTAFSLKEGNVTAPHQLNLRTVCKLFDCNFSYSLDSVKMFNQSFLNFRIFSCSQFVHECTNAVISLLGSPCVFLVLQTCQNSSSHFADKTSSLNRITP